MPSRLLAALILATALAAPPAIAQSETPAKQAFEEAKELGSVEAWQAFLKTYPTGFHADLARAYLKKLGASEDDPAAAEEPAATAKPKKEKKPAREAEPEPAETAEPEPAPKPKKKAAEKRQPAQTAESGVPPTAPGKAAVARGAKYMGFDERFNRYYTDPGFKPETTIYVSPEGGGDGTTLDTPKGVQEGLNEARPGTGIYFVRGNYEGCYELNKDQSGTYDAPVVLYGERNEDQSLGVSMKCCSSGRATCINLEDASYVAVDGFELAGGKYGVRAVGGGYDASQHSRGIAVINCKGHDQDRDPFFSGQSDWNVWEANLAYGAKKGDGHGIYISNGSDWNIVRFNETHTNLSSDFQINADPASTCKDEGIAYDDPKCDAYAGEGEGGRGASDYFLVDSNFFHHGSDVGANFTSVRRSIVRNNIFGPQVRHNVSFWQETDNPKLGSSENKILHNLFITNGKQNVQFIANSDRNVFANNILLGMKIAGGKAAANPDALLMLVDDTVGSNEYRGNLYVAGKIEGREPGSDETARPDFSPSWFTNFPVKMNRDPNDFAPTEEAPFRDAAPAHADAAADRNGTRRKGDVDLGPIEHQ